MIVDSLKSPLTFSHKIKKVESFLVQNIIENYSKIDLDVTMYFEGLDVIDLYECEKSGYRFYYPFSTIGDAKFYENLSKNKKNYYSRRWEHGKALNFINESDSVLEIGSGFGSFLNLLKENKIESRGLELNPFAVEKCVEEGLKVERKLIQEESELHKSHYDVVCSFQVLEHIVDVNSFINASIEALKNGGKLIIGVPNNNPYLFVNDKHHTLNLPPHHAGLWNEKSLKSLENLFPIKLEKITFEPIEIKYSFFINSYIHNLENRIFKKVLFGFNKYLHRYLKKIICKFVKGRNVIVVFKKCIDE